MELESVSDCTRTLNLLSLGDISILGGFHSFIHSFIHSSIHPFIHCLYLGRQKVFLEKYSCFLLAEMDENCSFQQI